MRDLATANDILLVFDEVVTGFRMAYGGAQSYYGVTPDLCTLGKVIGGGFPLAAVAGRDEVMSILDAKRADTDRFVPMVGTLSGNPVASAAGVATLKVLREPGTYDRLFAMGSQLMEGLQNALTAAELPGQVVGDAPMFDVVFATGEIRNYRDTHRADAALMSKLNGLLAERGILKSANKYYVSLALDENDIKQTITAYNEATQSLRA